MIFSNEIILFILGILACVSIILLVIDNEKNLMRNRVMNILSNYTLPIFFNAYIGCSTHKNNFVKDRNYKC